MSKSMEPRSARPPTQVEPPDAPSVQGLVTLAAGGASIASLYFGRELLIAVTLAVLLSFLVSPQESVWQPFAQVMRDNASTMDSLIQTRAANADSMSAVDDLRSYCQIVDAHADGVRKLTTTFLALYDSMSDAQPETQRRHDFPERPPARIEEGLIGTRPPRAAANRRHGMPRSLQFDSFAWGRNKR